jgi:transcriptional regulator with XRE-family HTH domain
MEEVMPPIQTLEELIRAVASRVRALRVSRNISQQDTAKKAGVSLRTLRRLENQGLSTLETLVRVLRALEVPDPLAALLPAPQLSPMALLHAGAHPPQRARRRSA